MLLAIDPGADSGWARFNSKGQLEACGLNIDALVAGISKVVIERPHTGKTKAPLKDVITLALRAGEWGGRVESQLNIIPRYIEPATWKGSVPKEISQARTWAKLTPDERIILAAAGEKMAPSKRHNMIDAVGIGLFVVER